MLFPATENNILIFNSGLDKQKKALYWLLLIFFIVIISILPLLFFDLSVRSSGIIRPIQERTELKPTATGIIDTIFFREGQLVEKNATILRIRNPNIGSKKLQASLEAAQRRNFLHDLQLLTSTNTITSSLVANLKSPLYQQQASRFLYQQAEQLALIKKVQKELYMDSVLLRDKVIAPKEMFDKVVENEKLQAAFNAFKQEQISLWQQDLARYRLELAQLQTEGQLLVQEQAQLLVKAPLTGILQGINTRYAGGLVQAGETIGTLSPEEGLVAECYVTPRDIGLLKLGQQVKYQVDAFDYNYFGMLTGKLLSIDNDFTVVDGKPLFKVRCAFDSQQLLLKNGFAGKLKKGMTVQARFIVARRSLWQLLWDKMDDWLNPAAPQRA